MHGKYFEEEQRDTLESLVALINHQTRLLEEIRDLLAQQSQRNASTRSTSGGIEEVVR